MGTLDRNSRPWLPGGALRRNVLDAALEDAIGLWSGKWFAGSAWRLSAGDPADGAERSWTGLADGVAIGLAADARGAVASAMLGGAPGQGFREPNDRRLAERLADACVDDLRKRVAQLFRLPTDEVWREGALADHVADAAGYEAAVCATGGRPHLRLVVSHALLVAWIKAGVSIPAQPIELGSLGESLQRHVVELGARVGGCALSLPELDALNVGDVLVLDRPLEGPLQLALDGRAVDRRCMMDAGEGRLALALIEPLAG